MRFCLPLFLYEMRCKSQNSFKAHIGEGQISGINNPPASAPRDHRPEGGNPVLPTILSIINSNLFSMYNVKK